MLLHQVSSPWETPASSFLLLFQAFMMKGNQKCVCRFCALKWGLRELAWNEQVENSRGPGIASLPTKKHCLPSRSLLVTPIIPWHSSPSTCCSQGLVLLLLLKCRTWRLAFVPESLPSPPQHSEGRVLRTVYLSDVQWVHKKRESIYTE